MSTLVGPPAWAEPGRPTRAHRASTATASVLRMAPPRGRLCIRYTAAGDEVPSAGRVGDLGGALEAVVTLEPQRQLALGPDQCRCRRPGSQPALRAVVRHDTHVVGRG